MVLKSRYGFFIEENHREPLPISAALRTPDRGAVAGTTVFRNKFYLDLCALVDGLRTRRRPQFRIGADPGGKQPRSHHRNDLRRDVLCSGLHRGRAHAFCQAIADQENGSANGPNRIWNKDRAVDHFSDWVLSGHVRRTAFSSGQWLDPNDSWSSEYHG